MRTTRLFSDTVAKRSRQPIRIAIAGPSFSGKTYSALTLATGIQSVVGGEIFVIDTEGERAKEHSDRFKFRHINFTPPFGPLDYLDAINHAVSQGAKTVIVDSMTHEHSGEGGVMWQSEQFLDKKCGDDEKAREKNFMLSLKTPKKQRRRLDTAITTQLPVNFILCYRAEEKIKPGNGAPIKIGWQPETTSKLHYEMAIRFLLIPGSDGKVACNMQTDQERMLVKRPEFSRDWYQHNTQITTELGVLLAKWASAGEPEGVDIAPQLAGIAIAPSAEAIESVLVTLRPLALSKEQKTLVKNAADQRKAELAEAANG